MVPGARVWNRMFCSYRGSLALSIGTHLKQGIRILGKSGVRLDMGGPSSAGGRRGRGDP
ncbi:hypothetical protein CHELA1G11_20057 [Hyphomicrobiales bacterium]|nr:hypothetical protein CHELA1G11_20057 [Hyphomicrobiales bacterium]CAH1688450.1 hypothetical protein CHELA1G2_20373 [Hyphomicrobiales bacterium]